MPAILKEEIRLDSSQHDKGLRSAAQSVGQYKKQVDDANKTIKGFQGSVSGLSSSLSGMVSAFRSGDIMGFASGAKNASGALTALIPTIGGTSAAVGGLGAAIQVALGPVGLAVAAISGVVAVGVAAAKSVEEFDKSLKDLSSLTGMTGTDLKDIGDSAVDLSMKFGTSATSIVDSFKLIGSQAPQLLQDKEGLEGVAEAAMVLAKAGGIEVQDAAKGITTVMNQMNVSATEATGIINALAAGSKNGAGDVAYLQTAIEKSGTLAANAGLSYQDLIGTIETLAPKFSSAEVAGTALKGVLTKLTTQGNSQFNPSVVGMQKALENLDKANLSASEKLKLFGESNLTAAETLIQNRDGLKEMTDAVTGTNTAYEQMDTKSGTLEGTINKLKSSWDALMITLGESASIQFVLACIKQIIKNWTNAIQVLVKVQNFWNEMVSVVCALVKKLWNDYVKPVWDKIANAITNSQIFKTATKLWNSLLDAVYKVFNQIAKWWNDFKKWLGMEGNAEVSVKQKVSVETENVDSGTGDKITDTKVGGTKKVKATGTKTETTTKAPTKGSLDETEAQITKLTTQLKNTDTNDTATVDALKKQIADLQKVADQQKIELGLTVKKEDAPKGSLKDVQDKLSKANTALQLVSPDDTDEVEKLKNQIKELTEKEHQIKVTLGLATVKPEAVEGSLKYIQNEISKYKGIIEITTTDSPEYKEAIKKLQDLTAQEQVVKVKMETDSKSPDVISKEQEKAIKDANKNMYSGFKDSWGAATGLADTISELSEGFEDMNALEIIESVGNAIFSVIDNISTLISSISQISSAIQTASAVETAASAASVVSSQSEAAASLTATTAKTGEALAGAAASGSSLPFPANIAAIAAGVAAVVGVIATIASMASGFASGGIVGGNTTVGDYNLIRANKGEMILSNRQQAHLFRQLNGGASGAIPGGEVKFRISGKELIGVLNNYNNKIAKVK